LHYNTISSQNEQILLLTMTESFGIY